MNKGRKGSRNPRKNDSISIYLQEIDQYYLLDREEEKELGRKARKGDSQAIFTLVNSNLRFVVKVSKAFQNMGLPLEDLISEGNLGLLEAAKRFDPERGIKFISYGVWWIKCYIRTALINQARLIRLPANKERLLNKIDRISGRLYQDLERPPTVEELAQETSSSADKIGDVLKAASGHLSLETPVNSSDSKRLAETIEDHGYEKTLKNMEIMFLRNSIKKSLASLNSREQKVISMRYGLEDGEPQTLQMIGKKMGLTRERIRQIQHEALEQLRNPLNSEESLTG